MTDARRAEIAALTGPELDEAVDRILRPGVAGTWPEHVGHDYTDIFSKCKRCGRGWPHKGACHVPPLPYATAEPGSEFADRLAGVMLRWLLGPCTVLDGGVRVTTTRTTTFVERALQRYAKWEPVAEGFTPNLALARAVIAAVIDA